MRILQVHNSYREHGGEDVSVASEAEILREGGHHVTQLLIRNPQGTAGALARFARAPHNTGAAKRVVRAARQLGADLVHVNNTWFSLSPAVVEALAESGIPTVATLRNYRTACMQSLLHRDGRVCMDCIGRSPVPGVRHRCYRGSIGASAIAGATISLARRRRSWERADLLLTPSESSRRILAQAGFDPLAIQVVPNAVLDPGPRRHPPSASSRLLYVGRLTAEKGSQTLLGAWRELTPPQDFELVLIGDGPLRAQLESDLPPATRIIGWRDPGEVQREMLRARALLFPTECLEPFGRGAAEAFAAGLPVLGSDLGGTAEIVAGLGPEWTVPAGDPERWARAIEALADGPRLDAAGACARDLYERRYSPPVARARLERVYGDVVRARRGAMVGHAA